MPDTTCWNQESWQSSPHEGLSNWRYLRIHIFREKGIIIVLFIWNQNTLRANKKQESSNTKKKKQKIIVEKFRLKRLKWISNKSFYSIIVITILELSFHHSKSKRFGVFPPLLQDLQFNIKKLIYTTLVFDWWKKWISNKSILSERIFFTILGLLFHHLSIFLYFLQSSFI